MDTQDTTTTAPLSGKTRIWNRSDFVVPIDIYPSANGGSFPHMDTNRVRINRFMSLPTEPGLEGWKEASIATLSELEQSVFDDFSAKIKALSSEMKLLTYEQVLARGNAARTRLQKAINQWSESRPDAQRPHKELTCALESNPRTHIRPTRIDHADLLSAATMNIVREMARQCSYKDETTRVTFGARRAVNHIPGDDDGDLDSRISETTD